MSKYNSKATKKLKKLLKHSSQYYKLNNFRFLFNIAGIVNDKGNVMGMMPHPERFYNNDKKDEIMKKILVSISNAR